MKHLLFLIIFCIASLSVFAQQDTARLKRDSLLNTELNNQSAKVQQLSAERLADSLRRLDLENQVTQLKSTDHLKRAALLQELAGIKRGDSLRLAKQKHQIDSLKHFVTGFAVAPFRDSLFYIFTRQGSFTPKDRAEAIVNRIRKLADDYNFKADSIKLSVSEQTMDILYKSNLLISVSEQDALWQNTSKEKLAAQLKTTIAKAVTDYRRETSWSTLVKEGLTALLVLVIVVLLIYGINRLFGLFLSRTKSEKSWYSNGIKIRNYELLNAEQELGALHFVIKAIKWVLVIVVVYLALPILFGIFPFTKDLSATLISYVTSPLKKIGLGIWNYIPNLITILVLVVIFRYVLKFFRYIKTEIERGRLTIPGFYADWANPTYQILRVLILAFMLIVIFPYMPGSDSPIFKGVSVFVGVLFTFGSAGALGNVVAGLVLTYMRAFRLGDRVKIGEVTGDIIARNLLVTRIRTIQNEIISIPNSTVMSNHTVNYSTDAQTNGLIIHTTVTIGYDAPWRQVHQLLIDAALATPMIDAEPTPYVLQTSLDDYYVSYRINAFTKQPNKQALIYSHLHQNIQDQFNQAGVEIMSPHYKALRDGNATTIPTEYLPKDYIAPPFKTQQTKDQ
ncbi:mechanosensitive ion channel family protein [Mucilaginibacter paludis]|uniref:MscS Mechanosensitive ion channel n=1 Tax=Mucilaginibacter paludis DSM 18603 TaxID=714943 RepID=H1YBF8_9SPHI|nr:mechanosensitive ion channel family protein [Mucilaginibacter paludis]EHQ25029.1 MscS Mechanosensitive ion channel [Mucilaginibacter paludis DSM 18603]